MGIINAIRDLFYIAIVIIILLAGIGWILKIKEYKDSKKEMEGKKWLEQQDEKCLKYYLEHKDDRDKSNLDQVRMEKGESVWMWRAVRAKIEQQETGYRNDKNDCGRLDNGDVDSYTDNSRHTTLEVLDYYQKERENSYKRNFGFVDPSGAYRRWGDDFIDYKGNWCRWGGGFYDKSLVYRNWGDTFIDGEGNFGSLKKGFYDAEGNWISGSPS